ncbi:type IV pilus assembly protein PilP [Pseudomonas sp. ok272]|uniref:pilus assembly protein PilP n=1 Tax=unclassified Pseudomonas TaxID=196821 RepID=UPI0008BEC980|nr:MULTISPECIES: pilus assembly protein PilP [unclassified Pseudomonas]SEN34367.1 type IV pilus assembly protein PilP [Pseudomonas sp. ok272]SFM84394.1 type IV pilus assembly protein PilP [Pseudomonas sp. ok602]
MSAARWLGVAMVLGGMAGCGDEHDFRDLDAYMNEQRGRAPGQIEPLPVFRAPTAFVHDATMLRSPFLPRVGPVARKPGPQRRQHYLEGFGIDQFDMVGTLVNGADRFVLLKGAGGVHRLQVGDYIGRSDGQVRVIAAFHVEVVEVVADGRGGWLERPRTFSLKTQS